MVLPYETEILTFRGQGSYRFTDLQRAAYRLILEIKILTYVQEEYANTKSLPVHGFWGYATIFHGGTVVRKVGLEFAKQRVLDTIRQDILNTGLIVQSHLLTQTSIANFAEALSLSPEISPWFTPTVLANPETVIKFKALETVQFEFICHWLPFEPGTVEALLFNSDDPTNDDDEYYRPERRSPGNPFGGNPEPSEPNPLSRPEDFDPNFGDDDGFVGTAVYEFRDAASAGWAENSVPDVGYPGFLYATNASNGNNEVSYQTLTGVQTVLVEGGSPPVQVRNFRINNPNGFVYTPFVDSFSH